MNTRRTITALVLALSLLAGMGGAFTTFAAPAWREQGTGTVQADIQAGLPVVDDFEAGLPAGWFQYGDYGNGVVITTTVVVTDTRPVIPGGVPTDTHVLSIDYTSAGWGAGTGRDLPGEDWSQYDGFSFWFYGANTGGAFRVVLSDNKSGPGDTAERFAYEFIDDALGWRFISIPWANFFRDYAYQPPGAPDDGLTLTEMWAYAFALPIGTAANIYLDDVALYKTTYVDDFEAGLPAGWFQYGDYGNGTVITTTVVVTDTRPVIPGGAPTDTHVLSIDYTSAGWGAGTGRDLPGEDWSQYDGFSFWFYGANTGGAFRVVLSDNKSGPGDTAERFAYEFIDDALGWRFISIPWANFFRDYAYQPPGAPDDGLTLTEMWAYAFALPIGTAANIYLDDVALLGGQPEAVVAFESWDYGVEEGGAATITVTLNLTQTFPVSVTYTTADGTATAGDDYTGTMGTLLFPAGTLVQTFTVETIDDTLEEDDETVHLTLSDPAGAVLGGKDEATLTLHDNELIDLCARSMVTIDDFESGLLPSGYDGDIEIGYITWSDGSPVAITTTVVQDTDPLALPGQVGPNIVLQFDSDIGSWGGLSNLFMNAAGDTWLSQDWSTYAGVGFWLYGEGDGGGLFFEIKDNRAGSPTNDDAEVWTYPFTDDIAGWRYVEIPFDAFTRKEIGNGAPNDGFGRTEVHGWAFGSLTTGGPQTVYIDNIVVLERVAMVDDFESGLPTGFDGFGNGIGFVVWGDTWNGTTIAITDTLVTAAEPLALPCQISNNRLLQMDSNVAGWAGMSHAFENAALDTWVNQDWSTYEGISFWLHGTGAGVEMFFDIADNRNPGSTGDDAERFTYAFTDDFTGWQHFAIPFTEFVRKDIGNGAPDDGLTLTEVHGWSFGSLASGGAQTHYLDYVMLYGDARQPELEIAFAEAEYTVIEGAAATLTVTLNYSTTEPVTVTYTTAESSAIPDRDFTPVSGTLVIAPNTLEQAFNVPTLEDLKAEGDERVVLHLRNPENAMLGFQQRAVLLLEDNDIADPNLLDDFEGFYPFATTGAVTLDVMEIPDSAGQAQPGQGSYEHVLDVTYTGAAAFTRTYPVGQDWSDAYGLSFWFYGNNTGNAITVEVLDNQAATTGEIPSGDWVLAWADEFNDPAGAPPNANVWTHEIGDGALNDIVGWGNSELQYYTDSTDNAATDGAGNLKITVSSVATDTTELLCHYGPCEYTSARLISANKAEFAYGKIEARIKVVDGQGLWPAFWMLGTDIGDVGWPMCGEIDIMEYVGKNPNEVFGTLHGPGYSGGNGFGNTYNFGYPVVDDYHTFTIEWAPDEIHWYVDGINFHNATPADVAPNTWVYNHPFYIILNAAIGGNFGGPVAPGLTFPRDMYVDYVRVYQAVDTAERFEATFDDNFTGWRKLTAPFADFTRSADQPAGAPDDGFGLTEVWGYGFKTPNAAGAFYLDQVQRAVVVEDSVPVSTPGCYDFPNTGAQICFDDTGSLTQVDVILRHQYPTGQLAALPLPRQYEITGIEGRAPFSATVYLPYSDADLTDGIIEDDLQLYRYLGGGAWQAYPSTVDTATNIVSAGGVAEFSIWAIGTAANPPSVVALTSLESQGRPGIWAAASMLVVALAISGGIWRRRRA